MRCEACFEEYREDLAAGVCPYCGYYEGFKQKDPRYLPIGTLIHDRYVVGSVIGDGGFGITYRVWDMKLNTRRAMKEYYQQGVVNRSPGMTEMFIAAPNRAEEFHYGKDRLLREARIVSQFQSAEIVRISDYFEENNTSYMVMEFLDMPTLAGWMQEQKQPFSPEEVRSIGIQMCTALKEIHMAGVIHRDIAPDNIFISEEGKIKIIDFGSARLSRDDVVERLILMKEGFSPIEQYEVIDLKQDLQKEWTDIYALGATLCYCVTGVRPQESRVRKTNVDNGQPDMPEPKDLNPNVDENLNNTIMKAMAINLHERFKTAEEMQNALQGDVKVLPLPVVRKRKRRIRALSIGGGLAAALIIIVASGILGKKNYDEVVLEAADITVWYSVPEGDETGSKDDALNEICQIEEDSEQFKNVTIDPKGIPEAEYEETLAEAYMSGEMPTIFECTDTDAEYMAEVADVSEIIRNMDGNTGVKGIFSVFSQKNQTNTRDCWFLKDYQDEFAKMGCIPTGFEVPILYVNTAAVPDYTEDTEIGSMGDLTALADGEMLYKPIAVDETAESLFSRTFSDYDDVIETMTVMDEDDFLDSKAAVYFSTTTKLKTALQLGSSCKVAQISDSSIECQFCNYWSISACSDAEQAAAEVLLAYMYTENAQDIYYLETEKKTALPLNKTILSRYEDVYWQLDGLVENCESYTFSDVEEIGK